MVNWNSASTPKNSPDLRINEQYAEMLRGYRDNLRGKKINQKTDKEAILLSSKNSILPSGSSMPSNSARIPFTAPCMPSCSFSMITSLQAMRESKAYDPKRHCRDHRLRYIYRFKGSQFKVCSNRIWYQTPERLFSESMSTSDGNEVSTVEVKNIFE